LAWAGRAPAASHAVSVLEPRSPPREGLAHGQPLQLCDAAQEPTSRSHIAYPSDGPRADRPCLELWRVYLAAGAHRSSPQQADGRTGHMFADSSSSGPIFGKNPSTYSRRDARRARKRGGPSAESCVRCLLLFSRTTAKFSLEESHIQFLEQCKRYGFKLCCGKVDRGILWCLSTRWHRNHALLSAQGGAPWRASRYGHAMERRCVRPSSWVQSRTSRRPAKSSPMSFSCLRSTVVS